MSRYLDAARAGLDTLLAKQSARLGGKADGLLCITLTRWTWETFRTVGAQRGDDLLTYLIQGYPIDMEPPYMDLRSWPMLELFSDVTRDPRYRDLAVAMARAFGQYGFDPASGLGYLGEEAEFDVVKLACAPVRAGGDPQFKPVIGAPLERLWAEAPEATARMIRSAYYGLVTRPETMDYNRHCDYGFDDSKRNHPTAFNSHHVGFAMAGACLVHWWGFLFARTGEPQCLDWSQAMADKWKRAQHPQSGLVPAWFGSDREDEDTQPPRPYCNYWDTIAGISFLRAAAEWKVRPAGQALARQLEEMGRRIIMGFARYACNDQTRLFPQWMNLDGSDPKKRSWYTFYSEAERDEAAKRDPLLAEVEVFSHSGFYSSFPSSTNAGTTFWESNVPYDVTLAARMTGDAYLLRRAEALAAIVVDEARNLTGEFNSRGQWTMPANALYVKMMLLLFETTRTRRYLDWAREIADMELEFLRRPLPDGKQEWWRQRQRDSWIEALLLLHQAMGACFP